MNRISTVLCNGVYFAYIGSPTAILAKIIQILLRRRLILFHRGLLKLWDILTYAPEKAPYEHEIAPFFEVEQEKCFLDVGANLGVYTTRLALKGVPVYAFEPSPEIFNALCQNVRDLRHVVVSPYALGDKNTETTFYLKESENLRYRQLATSEDKRSPKRIDVPVRTLDSLAIDNIGLIKIDTEGHEFPILKGAMRTLMEQKPRLIIEIHSPIWRNDILIMGLLRKANYKRIKRIWRSSHKKFFILADS